jgi:hypothetical protein
MFGDPKSMKPASDYLHLRFSLVYCTNPLVPKEILNRGVNMIMNEFVTIIFTVWNKTDKVLFLRIPMPFY